MNNCVLVLKECIAQADAMPLLYANILFQLALFNHAFSFLNDSWISQSRNGKITSTCQEGAFISRRDKCGRSHVNLSRDFFQPVFPSKCIFSTCLQASIKQHTQFPCPSKEASIHKYLIETKKIVFPELVHQAREEKKKNQVQSVSFIT